MKCPFCGAVDKNRVIDSRETKDGTAIRRRRECEACSRRFTTYEQVEEILPMIVKKDDRREMFSRGKLVNGLRQACQKRPITMAQIDALVDEIEKVFSESGEREVPSQRIGEEVMRRLKKLDPVAYLRFASVYRSFEDLREFVSEIERLERGGEE